jgi:hypothetical protein
MSVLVPVTRLAAPELVDDPLQILDILGADSD